MSDEYRNQGYKDTLVDDSIAKSGVSLDEATKNYPPQSGDTTSSGGYGTPDTSKTLIDQSTTGSNLRNETQDGMQGVDKDTRREIS
ncbi:hypothetical protein Moror_17306 [Moniliophthora roreri MCA 2997]|uniref:Uncharacterized protein n=2 Tax=Moniliophthora roreri TaxID=221103 RepID=V2XVT5_MONRO|nr:hypothetical protein Moror_17306 [Moniliophthora roreri MCA 2997]